MMLLLPTATSSQIFGNALDAAGRNNYGSADTYARIFLNTGIAHIRSGDEERAFEALATCLRFLRLTGVLFYPFIGMHRALPNYSRCIEIHQYLRQKLNK